MSDPQFNPECAGCTALAVALDAAMQLLSGVDSDANNTQLDISRLQRRYHAEIAGARTYRLRVRSSSWRQSRRNGLDA